MESLPHAQWAALSLQNAAAATATAVAEAAKRPAPAIKLPPAGELPANPTPSDSSALPMHYRPAAPSHDVCLPVREGAPPQGRQVSLRVRRGGGEGGAYFVGVKLLRDGLEIDGLREVRVAASSCESAAGTRFTTRLTPPPP